MRILFGAFALLAHGWCLATRPNVTLDIASIQPHHFKVTEENINDSFLSKILSSHNRIDTIVCNGKPIWKASNNRVECFYAKVYSNVLNSALVVNYGTLPTKNSPFGDNEIAYYVRGPHIWSQVSYQTFHALLVEMGWNQSGLVNVSLDVSQLSDYTFTVFHGDVENVPFSIFVGTDNYRITRVLDYCTGILVFDKDEVFTDAMLFFDKTAPALLCVSYISADRTGRKNLHYELVDMVWRMVNKDKFYSKVIDIGTREKEPTKTQTKDAMMVVPGLLPIFTMLLLCIVG